MNELSAVGLLCSSGKATQTNHTHVITLYTLDKLSEVSERSTQQKKPKNNNTLKIVICDQNLTRRA